MHIVGIIEEADGEMQVHTIDVWFSRRTARWLVERLDGNGDLIGLVHHCATEEDALACVGEWLRAHPETHLVSPRVAEKIARAVRRTSKRAA